MKQIFAVLAIVLAGSAAQAELVVKQASGSVAETMDALEAAVTKAGATIFARVDHTAGAKSVDLEMGEAQLLIFGNPKLGTPAMQADLRAGLYLPLKVLVYAGESGTVVTYELPAEMMGDLNVPADAPFLKMMTGALDKLTGAAIGG